MAASSRCTVVGCRHRDVPRGACVRVASGARSRLCSRGSFATALSDHLGHFGEWRLRQFVDGAARAALRGPLGTVEVWGGDAHAREVWFVERGTKAETRVTGHWFVRKANGGPTDADGMHVREAVERACAMAGIQRRLELD